MENEAEPIRPRSEFVGVLAWILIILFGFMLVIALLQLVMIEAMAPRGAFDQPPAQTAEDVPWVFRFLTAHFRLVFYGNALVVGAWFAGGLGLRKRREWARRMISWMLFLTALLMISMPLVQHYAFAYVSDLQQKNLARHSGSPDPQTSGECGDASPSVAGKGGGGRPTSIADPEFQRVLRISEAITAVFSTAIASLLAFLGWKLRTAKIRTEFS